MLIQVKLPADPRTLNRIKIITQINQVIYHHNRLKKLKSPKKTKKIEKQAQCQCINLKVKWKIKTRKKKISINTKTKARKKKIKVRAKIKKINQLIKVDTVK